MKIEVVLVRRAESRKERALSCDNEKERKASMRKNITMADKLLFLT